MGRGGDREGEGEVGRRERVKEKIRRMCVRERENKYINSSIRGWREVGAVYLCEVRLEVANTAPCLAPRHLGGTAPQAGSPWVRGSILRPLSGQKGADLMWNQYLRVGSQCYPY